jgi:hypothetical protein
MMSERLAKIEGSLRGATNIPEATRNELLDLVAGLKAELLPLPDTHPAQQIVGSTEAAVRASAGRDGDRAAEAVEGLSASVREFEATHPRLVEIVDQLASTLSNLGI